jgi:hypothetical protein
MECLKNSLKLQARFLNLQRKSKSRSRAQNILAVLNFYTVYERFKHQILPNRISLKKINLRKRLIEGRNVWKTTNPFLPGQSRT